MSTVIRVGTRGSALAMAQTKAIAARIGSAAKAEIEIVPVTTHGDTSRESLATIGGTGVFASALRESLLAGECDIIVHSLKDLPTAGYPGLRLAATPKRADARDTLCSRDGHTLDTLPEGARVGTGSPRRIAQLRKRRPDLEILDIRGNIDSRLARVSDELDADDPQRLDAILLAAAGLGRLGKLDHVSEYLDLSGWPTAPGQGALAIEVREDGVGEPLDRAVRAALESVNHGTTAATTLAERLVLAGLEAGCSAPVAAMAEVDSELLFLTATVYSLDGEQSLTSSHAATPEGHGAEHLADAARDVASRVVEELLGNGAADLAVLKGKP
ncbi:hydroxymethylbilane synthase [Microterricola pindariensis]|uniref:Hydroxymethylbilane synthase n=1 Tax=Microterricola pindariensis TaxID=478010 RepID=A0ABX5AYU4_9MICO|nr:hydroxymethylbilane synthase [Microterricola pindariensis]PPL19628.1 hydroxymethylbilane synthase [Microterricola pindariensis]